MRRFYVNRNARVGDTFGLFADREAALVALRASLRDLNTHTIVRTSIGYLVTCRGY
jgi:hypothetical protein